jgi:Ca2+-binding EF-hand superfamily protein
MTLKMWTVAMGALVLAAQSGVAQTTPGKELAEVSFAQIDANADQTIAADEMKSFANDVLVSMDGDSNSTISLPEFQGWDFGFVNIADQADKLEGFATAQRVVFDLWDRDNDGAITSDEMQSAMDREIAYADLDANGALSLDEYLMGFAVNLAYRSALKP